jgi:hypothetical protein
MTATVAARPDSYAVYCDHGPIARALGGTLGRRVPLPAEALAAAAALPLLAAIVLGAGEAVAGAVIAWAVLCGGLAAGRPPGGRLRWTLCPVLRAVEYGGLLWLATLAGDAAVPAAFALLAAISFRVYDLVYRLRIRGTTPAPWVSALSGGWDGRLLLAFVLLVAGALPAGFYVWAAVAAAVFVGESVAGWARTSRDDDETPYENEDDD